jgi:hypothetical protein
MMRSASKRGKRTGAASALCPKCRSNSRVTFTKRFNGAVLRERRCLGPRTHKFNTKEISIWS